MKFLRRLGQRAPFGVNAALLALAFLLSLALGPVIVPLEVVGRLLGGLPLPAGAPEYWQTILYQIRLPNAALVALTGAALGGSGAAYQGLFRNPLADPYLIGVASGAGLGAVVALSLHWPTAYWGFAAIPAAAFLGALLTVGVVYSLARVNQMLPVTTLVLAGVAVSSFTTALSSFLMLRSDQELRRALSWLLGGSLAGGWEPFWAALPYVAVGLGALLFSGHALNVLQYGEEQASQLGLNVARTQWFLVLAATLATAAVVAFSGLIGFVGLIVPHLARFFWGPDYRKLVGLSALLGASLLLGVDVAARLVIAPQVVPVGIVTALLGTPFFLWVLRRARSEVFW